MLLSQRMQFIHFRHGIQELAPHTSPIFVSACRLLPAGVALVAWAAANGRQQPKDWQAWFACALFGLIDGTAFQVLLPCDPPHHAPVSIGTLPPFHWPLLPLLLVASGKAFQVLLCGAFPPAPSLGPPPPLPWDLPCSPLLRPPAFAEHSVEDVESAQIGP